jgi:hypothetical protein
MLLMKDGGLAESLLVMEKEQAPSMTYILKIMTGSDKLVCLLLPLSATPEGRRKLSIAF